MAPTLGVAAPRRDASPARKEPLSPPATGQGSRVARPAAAADDATGETPNAPEALQMPVQYNIGLTCAGYVVLVAVILSMFLAPFVATFSIAPRLAGSATPCSTTATRESMHLHMMENWLLNDGELVPKGAHNDLKTALAAFMANQTGLLAKLADVEDAKLATEKALNESLAANRALNETNVLLNETIANLTDANALLTAEVATLKKEIEGLKAEVAQHNTTIAGLRSEIEAHLKEIAGLKEQVKKLKVEKKKLEEEIKRYAQVVVPGKDEEIDKLKKEIAALKKTLEALKKTLELKEETIRGLEAELKKYKEVVVPGKDEEIGKLKKEIADLNQQLTKCNTVVVPGKDEEIGKLRKEIAVLKKDYAELADKFSKMREKLKSLSDVIATNRAVTDAANKMKSMNDEVTELLVDIDKVAKEKVEVQSPVTASMLSASARA